MASILGDEVLTDDYETRRIQIAFNPQTEIFEVANPAIAGNPAWITDIAYVFDPATPVSCNWLPTTAKRTVAARKMPSSK